MLLLLRAWLDPVPPLSRDGVASFDILTRRRNGEARALVRPPVGVEYAGIPHRPAFRWTPGRVDLRRRALGLDR